MITLQMITGKITAWLRYRDAVRELSQLSDHELCDIGVHRFNIEDVVRRNAAPHTSLQQRVLRGADHRFLWSAGCGAASGSAVTGEAALGAGPLKLLSVGNQARCCLGQEDGPWP